MQNKICVYAICKNEKKFVDQWLDNVSEADYIVVLDTGSTDGTFEKLKEDPRITTVKRKIIKPWRFDVARNESMKLVPEDANILISTDFDELLSKDWADILRANWKEDTTRAFYSYAWSHNEIGERTDIFIYDKIHSKDYKWIYPVHEVLSRDDPEKQVSIDLTEKIWLDHYQDAEKSRSNYMPLLQLSVKENPADSHVRMLLAREYLISNELEKALDEYLAVLKMPDVEDPNKHLVLLESLGRCADIYKEFKNYDEAIWYSQEFIKEDPTYLEPYLILGDLYNNMNMFTLAEAMVECGRKYATRKYNWIERANTWVTWPDEILSYTYYKLDRLDDAIDEIKKVLKHHPDNQWALKTYSAYLEQKLESIKKKIS